ncbi:nucleoside hydrolase [Lyngbya sp. CCY1209]|uniref:nucleoside hydrolase n=1 Tax=Lyngbya sp. CCY1209 TaxID=2886103 RepID=UPI002D2026E3|nr:nucleoside hydrolase [Lyngbya sp. CCY1209]MEB3882323.1 nucleoside hydrolase [Lyngbya sp. CCY1209]
MAFRQAIAAQKNAPMKMRRIVIILTGILVGFALVVGVGLFAPATQFPLSFRNADPIPVIFDTDTNNELDDQHALAYLLFNRDIFDVRGITTNATFNGGDIVRHDEEAVRVMKLCGATDTVPLYSGANGDFAEIRPLGDAAEDGREAIDFIIREARTERDEKLVLLAVGKLTNVALAFDRAPDIVEKVRLVWLGSNYPEPGEYNLDNDIPALDYLLESRIPFEMVTVRYGGGPTGAEAVKVQQEDILENVKGRGIRIETPVTGRHGGEFDNFGDYSASLFANAEYYGDPPSRSLFDVVAVAVVKNPDWGEYRLIPAPRYEPSGWVDRPENEFQIGLWENFDRDAILQDFYQSMARPATSAKTRSRGILDFRL